MQMIAMTDVQKEMPPDLLPPGTRHVNIPYWNLASEVWQTKESGLADELGSGMRNAYKYTRLYSGAAPEFVEGGCVSDNYTAQ